MNGLLPLFLYKQAFRDISRVVMLRMRNARAGLWSVVSIGFLAFTSSLECAEPSGDTLVIAFARVQQPALIAGALSEQPVEFSQNPFAIYLLYKTVEPSQLHRVICVPSDSALVWGNLVSLNSWKSLDMGTQTCFVEKGSSLDENNPGIEKVVEFQNSASNSAASVGLLPDTNALLYLLFKDDDLRDAFFGTLLPFIEGKQELYRSYLKWWVQELTSMQSLSISMDSDKEDGAAILSLQSVAGTRLYRLLQNANRATPDLFGYVPGNAPKVTLGQLDAAAATSYWNFIFKGTNLIESEIFKRVHTGLNLLDHGFFDLWDGNFAMWTPPKSQDRILLIGGRYVTTDLSDLFDMLENVSWEETGLSLELDKDNSVVGFTRVRSMDWKREEKNSWLPDTWLNNRFYFAVADGCLVISESESQIIDLVFKLNSRQKIQNSALDLMSGSTSHSIGIYENGAMTGHFQFNSDGMLKFQNQSVESLAKMFSWIINNSE
jgi:hypothetical protein